MDKTQHKIAMEFFRSEIKKLAKRLSTNKLALRQNQRSISKGQTPVCEYDKTDEKYWSCGEIAIMKDKRQITALHIVYGEVRGKCHFSEKEKEIGYAYAIEIVRKRMEEYIKQKQASLVQPEECSSTCTTSTRSV